MKFLSVTLVLLGLSPALLAQRTIEGLPDFILKNANEIVLEDHTDFHVETIGRSVLNQSSFVAILNSNAANLNEIYLHYHDFSKIVKAKVEVYDSSLKKVDSYSLKDFNDWATGSYGLTIASDSRVKHLSIQSNTYPYYISIEYEKVFTGSLHYPTWYPQKDENIAVLNSSLVVRSYQPGQVRYKGFNIDPPEESDQEGNQMLKWEVNNLSAFEWETMSKGLNGVAPMIRLAPSEFMVDNRSGRMTSWNEFGHWINRLNDGRDDLETSQIADLLKEVNQLTKAEDKIRFIYKHLQNNTRYVGVQQGIGGWQPFKSSYVHDQKFGDCKALSFYTQSLLKKAGITSYYTLINAGKYSKHRTLSGFPSGWFNHAILTVPLEQDTIWLECTSQTNPFGYLGTWTSDRNALLITHEGGKVIRTKAYSISDNQQVTTTRLEMQEDGSMSANIKRTYTGIEIENDDFVYQLEKSQEEQKEWVYDELGLGDIRSLEFNFHEITEDVVPKTGFEITATIDGMISKTGDRIFIDPFTFDDWADLSLNRRRQSDIQINYPYSQIDTLEIKFPPGYYLESMHRNQDMTTKYGVLNVTAEFDGEHYRVVQRVEINKGTYPASDYSDFRKFLMEIRKNGRRKIVALDKT